MHLRGEYPFKRITQSNVTSINYKVIFMKAMSNMPKNFLCDDSSDQLDSKAYWL